MAKDRQKKKHKSGHRNNGGGSGGSGGGGGRGRSFARKVGAAGARAWRGRAQPPDWKTTAAAIIGGAGSAALSGLLVNQKVLSEEAAAIGMIGVGGATAWFADGPARVVGNSVASAGAGQLALAWLARRAVPKSPQPANQNAPAAKPAAALPAPAEAPAASGGADYRRDPFGGGYVTRLFRDAANELEMADDEEARMGVRDADDGGIDVYDVGDLAA